MELVPVEGRFGAVAAFVALAQFGSGVSSEPIAVAADFVTLMPVSITSSALSAAFTPLSNSCPVFTGKLIGDWLMPGKLGAESPGKLIGELLRLLGADPLLEPIPFSNINPAAPRAMKASILMLNTEGDGSGSRSIELSSYIVEFLFSDSWPLGFWTWSNMWPSRSATRWGVAEQLPHVGKLLADQIHCLSFTDGHSSQVRRAGTAHTADGDSATAIVQTANRQ